MPPSLRTVREALAWATPVLSSARVPSPRLDAEVLLAHVVGWRRARLYAAPEFELAEPQQEVFQAAVERRRRREPVPYIVGHREFYGLDFCVDRRVLIPRPETELLVERALEWAKRVADQQQLALADIGTGSGTVATCLAVGLVGATIYATDSSAEALQVAAANVARHGVCDRVHLLLGDLLEPVPGCVHLIVANLPYVPSGLLASLDPDVAEYEPLAALDGGADGLAHIGRLLSGAKKWLRPRGAVLLEIGAGQGQQVLEMAAQYFPAARAELFQDYAGLDRIVRIGL